MSRLLVIALSSAFLALGLSAAPSAHAGELPPRQDKIVYTCSFDFVDDICSMNSDGSGELQLTDDPDFDEHPAISPDGTQIAWSKSLSSQLWIMDLDGSNQRGIGNFEGFVRSPAWSPNGGMLAFACSKGGDVGICTTNSNGSGQTLVAAVTGAIHPDWSRDATKIIFTAQEIGQNETDIYVVTLATGQIINLTNTSDQSEAFPRWSPDGTKLAFWSDAPTGSPDPSAIYTMDANGANREEVFDNAPFSSAAWSPDGTQIAVVCDPVPGQRREMCVVNSETGAEKDVLEPTMGRTTETWANPSWATTGGGLSGDIDCSGRADTIDSLKLLRYTAGLSVTRVGPCLEIGEETVIDGTTRIWGDVDCSGAINAVDALALLRFAASLPVQQEDGCPPLGQFLS